jgi:hypothetical protein
MQNDSFQNFHSTIHSLQNSKVFFNNLKTYFILKLIFIFKLMVLPLFKNLYLEAKEYEYKINDIKSKKLVNNK